MSAPAPMKSTPAARRRSALLWIAPAALLLTGCVPMIGVIGTDARPTLSETAVCEAWAASLPSRSRRDTLITQEDIGAAYDAAAAACGALGIGVAP